MQSLIDALASFNTYLIKGLEKVEPGHLDLVNFQKGMEDIDPALFKDYVISDEKINTLILDILINLKIPKKQWGRYIGAQLSVYDFLLELRDYNKAENSKVTDFIDFIDEQAIFSWKKTIIGSLLLVIFAESGLAVFATKGVITTIQSLMAGTLFVPVVGAIYTTVVAVYSIYENLTDKKTPLLHKIHDNLFLLAGTGLKFAAYGLLITAAATTAVLPLAAGLFVAAAAVFAIKEIVGLVRMKIQENHTIKIPENASLREHQQQARQELEYIKARNDRVIKIAPAVLYVGLIAVSSFVPGGIFVTAAVFLAMAVAYIIEKKAINYNNSVISKQLEHRFETLEQDYNDKKTLQNADLLDENVIPDDDSAVDLGVTLQREASQETEAVMELDLTDRVYSSSSPQPHDDSAVDLSVKAAAVADMDLTDRVYINSTPRPLSTKGVLQKFSMFSEGDGSRRVTTSLEKTESQDSNIGSCP